MFLSEQRGTFAHAADSAHIWAMQQTPLDIAIIGGGHNGLACAAYLAGAGLSVVVLEKMPSSAGRR